MNLKACKLFEGLSDKEIKRIAADMTEVTHPAEETHGARR